jgi:hypothetical protein
MAYYHYNGYYWKKHYGGNGKGYSSKEKALLNKFKIRGITFNVLFLVFGYINAYLTKVCDYQPIITISLLLIVFFLFYGLWSWSNYFVIKERLEDKRDRWGEYEFINREPSWWL